MLQYANVWLASSILTVNLVKLIDFLSCKTYNDSNSKDNHQQEEQENHQDQVDNKESRSLSTLLAQVKKVKVLVRNILPRNVAWLDWIVLSLIPVLFWEARRTLALLVKVFLVSSLNFHQQVLLLLCFCLVEPVLCRSSGFFILLFICSLCILHFSASSPLQNLLQPRSFCFSWHGLRLIRWSTLLSLTHFFLI